MKSLIDNIVKISLDANINKNPALMNDTLELLSRYEFELPMLLNRNGTFKEGYYNFLKSDKDVALDDKHIEEAAIYIKQHLQGEVGLWSENEVNMQLLRWKASLTPKPTLTPQPTTHNPYPSTVSSSTAGYNNTQDSLSLKMGEAMEHIKQIDTLTQAQQILEELCKLGYDDIFNIILKN